MSLVCILIFIFSSLYFLLHRVRRKSSFKPGFPGLQSWFSVPIFGHSYLLWAKPLDAILDLKKKHGPIFRCDINGLPTVFLPDWRTIREASKSESINARALELTPIYDDGTARPLDSKGETLKFYSPLILPTRAKAMEMAMWSVSAICNPIGIQEQTHAEIL
jgi:hypothetical protein